VEPFYFVIACVGVRALADPFVSVLSASGRRLATRRRVIATAVCVLVAVVGVTAFRGQRLMAAQQQILTNDKVFWDSAAGQAASFLTVERLPGKVAVWDIGFVGYATDYPLFDLFGLVTPATSDLPGGYSRRYTPEWVNRVLSATPDYFVLVGKRGEGCTALSAATEQLRTDRRFQDAYKLGARIQHTRGGHWCIFEKRETFPAHLPPSPPRPRRGPADVPAGPARMQP
jgi:arabinofuranosyltransferase